jgi:hypothetical protein
MRLSVLVGAAVILAIGGMTNARANLLVNGSFETPPVPVGAFTNFNTGSTAITGWTVVGPQVSIVSGKFTQGGFRFPAQNGAQWLDLTGDGTNTVQGVSQNVATKVGGAYLLTYFVGNVSGGIFGKTSTVEVLVNGKPVATSTNSEPGTTLRWERFSKSFTATSSSTSIEFLNKDPSNDNSNGLDNVILAPKPAAAAPAVAPEPATLPLFAAALIALAAARLRKSRSHQQLPP